MKGPARSGSYAGFEEFTRRLASSWRWQSAAFGLVGLLAWVALHAALVPYLVEDSYIHFRVAENLVETGNPYFNTGEAVKTSSSTPWTWLLALLFWFSPRNLSLLAVFSALVSAAGAAAWLVLLRSTASRKLLWWEALIALVAYLSVVQSASIATMETGLALAFATAGLAAFVQRKPWAFCLLGLAAATRLEFGALLVSSAVVTLATRAMPYRACLLWALAGSMPSALFDLIQYHTLVPQAALAKPIIHRLSWVGSFSLLLPEAILAEFYYHALVYAAYATLYVLVATLPLLRLTWSRDTVRDPAVQVMAIAAITGLAIAVTYAAARSIIFPWYRPLYFGLLFLPALIGAIRSRKLEPYLWLAAALLPLLYDLGGSVIAACGRPEAARHFLEGARARQTSEVAAELYREYPHATLMTSEIGAVGFGFRGRIQDGAGLASPEALRYYPLPVPAERYDTADAPVPLRYLKDRRPGLVMAVDRHLDAVLSDPVRAEYVHVRRGLYSPSDDARRPSETLLWDSIRSLDVLIRRDLWLTRHHETSEEP